MRGFALLLAGTMSFASIAAAQTDQQAQASATQTASAGQPRVEASAQTSAAEPAKPPLPDMMSTFEYVSQDWR